MTVLLVTLIVYNLIVKTICILGLAGLNLRQQWDWNDAWRRSHARSPSTSSLL